jgi:2-polyprenyl-3-methyl-5-hydroxy-6-metoxy-1,4-benzoquinol methylase
MNRPAHLPNSTLDQYLHRTLPAADHQHVRQHLDACEPCWQAWNQHRWNAAQTSPLYTQLAEFLGPAFHPYYDSSRALAAEWDAANPRTEREIAQFFRTSTSYLYNLAIWEASGNRPNYLAHALPTLGHHRVRTILDYGCGIGSDTLPLHHNGFTVTGCDYTSPSTAFLTERSSGTIPVIEPGELGAINPPDVLWIIDTLDHLTDIEASLHTLLPTVDLVVTEDLTASRGHGRQRFHHRRSFSELTALFNRHGLTPATAAPGNLIMVWTRDRT